MIPGAGDTSMAGRPLPPRIPGAGAAFGLPDIAGLASRSVSTERPIASGPSLMGQQFCREEQTPGTVAAASILYALGVWVSFAHFPVGLVLAVPLFAGAEALRSIGPGFTLGDALARVINLFTSAGVAREVFAAIRAMGQRKLIESAESA